MTEALQALLEALGAHPTWALLVVGATLLAQVHGLVALARWQWPGSRTLADMHARARTWWWLFVPALLLTQGEPGLAVLTLVVLFGVALELAQAWRAHLAGDPASGEAGSKGVRLGSLTEVLADSSHDAAAGTPELVLWGLCSLSGLALIPAVARPAMGGSSALVLWALLCVQLSDALQYVFGKLFGRRALAPSISPAKTREGFVLGAAGAVATATLLGPLVGRSYAWAAVVAAVLAFGGLAGGLFSSAAKRALGRKDWGHWLAGHGGLLDRVDSAVFVAPLLLLVLMVSR